VVSCFPTFYVRWVPCHNGMALGEGFQISRVAANILNKQSTGGGGPPDWGLSGG
jgi:hypothetical protein